MNVHQRADSSQADPVPAIAKMSVINSWKKRNNADREIRMSQGWETAAIEPETGTEVVFDVLACMIFPFGSG